MTTFPNLSIVDILDGTTEPGLFQGKIVLIGATAVGIYDLRVTPFSPVMPGVEKQANMISSILESRFIKEIPFSENLIVLVASGVLFSLFVARLKAFGTSIMTALFLLVLFGSSYVLFSQGGIWVSVVYPSNNILLIFISIMAYNYAVEERSAQKIKSMFSNYVTERVMNELIKNPGMAKLGGERRKRTVLFSDLRGLT